MSSAGNLSALGRDIDGLIQYVEVLVSGNSGASRTGKPLGNKFFLQTGAKCKDVDTNKDVDRYIYIDNVPEGNIPIISSGLGVNFTEFKGLIPGTISSLNTLNPFNIMRSFLSGSTPACQNITLETIDINNNKSSETHYVTTVDIQNMDPCIFREKINPISGKKCIEGFDNNYSNYSDYDNIKLKLPEDPVTQLYFASLAGVGIYILYSLMTKKD